MGSMMLQHLPSAWHVDQAIVSPLHPYLPYSSSHSLSHPHLRPFHQRPSQPAQRRIAHSLPALRQRRGRKLHGHGRAPIQDSGQSEELRRHLRGEQQGNFAAAPVLTTNSVDSTYAGCTGLQWDVRALRSVHRHVLLAKQAHASRLRHGQ